MTAPKIGIVPDMSEHEYHADPCEVPSLTQSIARVLIDQSPAHVYLAHPRLGGQPRAPTAAMELGSFIHSIVLGQPNRARVIDAKDYRSKSAQQARDEARGGGAIPVLAGGYVEIIETARAIAEGIVAAGVDLGRETAVAEASIFWREGDVQCRGRLDYLDGAEIVDLKTTRDASRSAVQRSIMSLGYDIQAAAYIRGVEAVYPDLVGRVRYRWVFAETAPPYAVAVYRPAPSMLELGRERWDRAVSAWEYCARTGQWPGYGAQQIPLEAPAWAMREMATED